MVSTACPARNYHGYALALRENNHLRPIAMVFTSLVGRNYHGYTLALRDNNHPSPGDLASQGYCRELSGGMLPRGTSLPLFSWKVTLAWPPLGLDRGSPLR